MVCFGLALGVRTAHAQHGDAALWFYGNGGYSSNTGTIENSLLAAGASSVDVTASFPASLSNYLLVFLSRPSTAYDAAQTNTLTDFVAQGGLLVMLADAEASEPATFGIFNNLLSLMGMGTTFSGGTFDTGCASNATVVPGHPLVDGITELWYASCSDLSVGGNGIELAIGVSGQTVVVVEDNVLMVADLNVFVDSCSETTFNVPFHMNLWTSWDLDEDGWGLGDGDCDDTDDSVYPGAVEVCDDGIDQNCDGVGDELGDNDGDGLSQCDGDCNDADISVFPGAVEVCDGFDTDCDGDVDEDFDLDLDGWTSCEQPPDCDDSRNDVYPDAPELCDFVDNDCDGSIDNDEDGDGDGYTVCGGDCDDSEPSIYPGAPELCDEQDTDCDGVLPEAEHDDVDADGFVACADCNDVDAAINPGAQETCNGIDDNCNGDVDEGLDGDGDGHSPCDSDCDDTNPQIYAGAPEICDGLDNNCDEQLGQTEYDGDGDGYLECEDCDDEDASVHPQAPETCDDGIDSDCLDDLEASEVDNDGDTYSECAGDCDDEDPATSPGAIEICDWGHDNDCNPATDENADTDEDQFTICAGDCDDLDADVNPQEEEICDHKDNDCNGLVDEDIDNDLDGWIGCGGDDCDDHNAEVYPGAFEAPYDGIDQDCDGSDLNDIDGDGYEGGPYGDDCDDTNPDVNPGADEVCHNGIDDNCNGIDDAYEDGCIEGDDDDDHSVDCSCSSTAGGTPPLPLLPGLVLNGLFLIRRRCRLP